MKVVYAIINLINGKKYIGSTTNLSRRKKKHLYLLRLNKHHSPSLQHSYNKHTIDNFKFIILENLSENDNMYDIEQKWLDYYKTYDNRLGYNISTRAIAPCRTDLEKVYQYDFNGNLINIYSNSVIASDNIKCSSSGISGCCRGKYRFYKGYVWFYEKDTNQENIENRIKLATSPVKRSKESKLKMSISAKNRTDNRKPILQLDLNDNLIKEWCCTKDASDVLGFSNGQLSDCLNGKHKQVRGYKWKFKKI